ncbi:hypothetical protein C8Q73DRAFT_146977 [Cubamyces lactineus]|nr:hypothetical protein C8Q73DRAFT_146977 [Cubamyces lactineus]
MPALPASRRSVGIAPFAREALKPSIVLRGSGGGWYGPPEMASPLASGLVLAPTPPGSRSTSRRAALRSLPQPGRSHMWRQPGEAHRLLRIGIHPSLGARNGGHQLSRAQSLALGRHRRVYTPVCAVGQPSPVRACVYALARAHVLQSVSVWLDYRPSARVDARSRLVMPPSARSHHHSMSSVDGIRDVSLCGGCLVQLAATG